MGPRRARDLDQLRPSRLGALDLNYAKAFGTYSTSANRLEASATISFGPEVSLIGHDESQMTRAGAFLRFDKQCRRDPQRQDGPKTEQRRGRPVYVGRRNKQALLRVAGIPPATHRRRRRRRP